MIACEGNDKCKFEADFLLFDHVMCVYNFFFFTNSEFFETLFSFSFACSFVIIVIIIMLFHVESFLLHMKH